MQSQPNWARLVQQGRAKAPGVPWNDEELYAVNQLGIPAEYVRDGITTEEDYEKALKAEEKGEKPLSRQSRPEIEARARELDINFTPGTALHVLVNEINKAEASGKKPSKKEEVSESMKRDKLDAIAKKKGLNPNDYANKSEVVEAINSAS